MNKQWLIWAAVLGALAVALGAFGAHALKESLLVSGRLDTYETAVKYQMYHALALLFVSNLKAPNFNEKLVNWASVFFIIGVIIFSGSLYILCLSGITLLGAITPIGGVFLIIAWCLIIYAGLKRN